MKSKRMEHAHKAQFLHKECLIGVDLGATNVRVARIEKSEIVQLEEEKIVNEDDPDKLLDQIEGLIESVISPKVNSIGIGVPSVVDVEKGIVYDVQNIPSWKEVPIKSIYEEKFDKPVFVNNDANCFVLGEVYFGIAQGRHSVVGLVLGSGFGSGLYLNGHLYPGSNCGAGEVGMLPYKESIFEHYCSGMFFDREYYMSGEAVFQQAQKGQNSAITIYKSFGNHLGNALKAVLYAYDPEMIVFGGSIRKAYSFFEDSMHDKLKEFAYPISVRRLQIEVSKLENAGLLGAAALAADEI